MAERIAIYRSSIPVPMPGFIGANAHWPGFVMEWHELPPGEFPDCEFHCHIVAVERNLYPFRIIWKENGRDKWAPTGPGSVFVRSQQPLCSLRTTGTQRAVTLAIEPRAMELALPEPWSGRPVELIPKGIGNDAIVNHLVAVLEAELEAGTPGGELLLGSVARSMAIYLASRYSARPAVLRAGRRGLSRDRLARVIEYVEANLAANLSLDELAGVACLSSYHFGRMFKASTGQSVHQFVLNRRIERSKGLLRRAETSLAEAAAAVGFCGQSQFTTTFRRLTGVTPGVWRRELGIER